MGGVGSNNIYLIMNTILLLLSLALLLSPALAKEWYDNDIPNITGDNVLEILGKDKDVVVKFFTPWCYFCKKMNNDFE